ncbi:MAG: tRNA (adenosine(37)-N6)-threonylcarbamoyltransferase complex transferase subunit TsaD [bacterium]|jgi:N6-L-threonylcarbamoyladenine synthase|nr:tRNA (adenosine(37)-N6)-threonylcarbamoyltransferase complex transferase subunit TsaD [bacterium]
MRSKPTLLAIETSCDETAAAILRGFDEVLAHEIFSQASIHAQFGGVVPEVASRNHLISAPHIINQALESAGMDVSDLDAIAATTGPGLASALLVGASTAKGLSLGSGKPFLAINHIEGHLLSPFFGKAEIPPHIALVVSGGHTLLFDVEGFGKYQLLGRTLDDAAGEAFDKVAKLLGLGYPGGAEIDRLARSGNPKRHDFPRGMIDSGDYDFSFSGLKTALRIFLEKNGPITDGMPDICASFQAAITEVLVAKLFRAAAKQGRQIVTISGGVSANASLRSLATSRAERDNLNLLTAPAGLHTDNALMIAYTAAHHLAAGHTHSTSVDIFPNFDPATISSRVSECVA